MTSFNQPPVSRRKTFPPPPPSFRIYDSALSPRLVTPPSSPPPLPEVSDSSSSDTPPEAQPLIPPASLLALSSFPDRKEWLLDLPQPLPSLPISSNTSPRSLLALSPFFDLIADHKEFDFDPKLSSTPISPRKRPIRPPSPQSNSTPSQDSVIPPRKKYQRLLPAQRQILEAQFKLNPYLTRSIRYDLAMQLNVPPRRVIDWFHNQRQKLRTIESDMHMSEFKWVTLP